MANRPILSAIDPGGATLEIDYDDVTLKLTQVVYFNPTSATPSIVFSGPFNRTITAPANTPLTVVDISSANIQLTLVNEPNGKQLLQFPGNEQITFT